MRPLFTWIVLVSLVAVRPAGACTWDYDTLEMERQQYPEVHELLAGHFVRHSEAYYQWRIGDRTTKSVDQRTPADYNDIGVAYDKLGEHDKAIDTIREKLQRWPDENLYESHANLGTFLIHNGQYEEGLTHIKQAIEINPEAHFGREIYQQLLVEYVVHQRKAGASLPLHVSGAKAEGGDAAPRVEGFAAFVADRRGADAEGGIDAEYERALKGVLGMVRFGQHDSPILMEAVGDLISVKEPANLLAARAYLRASYEAEDADAQAIYRQKAENAIASQRINEKVATMQQIEAALKSELAQADKFAEQIAADEAAWIAAGENVDQKFSEKYYSNPQLDIERSQAVQLAAREEYDAEQRKTRVSYPSYDLEQDVEFSSVYEADPFVNQRTDNFPIDGRLIVIGLVLALITGTVVFRRLG